MGVGGLIISDVLAGVGLVHWIMEDLLVSNADIQTPTTLLVSSYQNQKVGATDLTESGVWSR